MKAIIYYLSEITLTVSKGCPTTMVQTPPRPPAKKFLMGLTRFPSAIFMLSKWMELNLKSNSTEVVQFHVK